MAWASASSGKAAASSRQANHANRDANCKPEAFTNSQSGNERWCGDGELPDMVLNSEEPKVHHAMRASPHVSMQARSRILHASLPESAECLSDGAWSELHVPQKRA